MELDVAITGVTNAPNCKCLSLVSNFSCSVFADQKYFNLMVTKFSPNLSSLTVHANNIKKLVLVFYTITCILV